MSDKEREVAECQDGVLVEGYDDYRSTFRRHGHTRNLDGSFRLDTRKQRLFRAG
jgi:hypothetical protein